MSLFIVPVESSMHGFPHLSQWLPGRNHVPPERERLGWGKEDFGSGKTSAQHCAGLEIKRFYARTVCGS